jgi:hypothetical protein
MRGPLRRPGSRNVGSQFVRRFLNRSGANLDTLGIALTDVTLRGCYGEPNSQTVSASALVGPGSSIFRHYANRLPDRDSAQICIHSRELCAVSDIVLDS